MKAIRAESRGDPTTKTQLEELSLQKPHSGGKVGKNPYVHNKEGSHQTQRGTK